MKKVFLLFVTTLFCFSSFLLAQTPPCGFDIRHKKLLAEDPAYARTIEQNEQSIKRYITAHPELGQTTNSRLQAPLFTIPVVVHVIHTGGAVGSIYNPTDAQIISTINYLNQVYNGTYPGTEGVGDLQVQFALAQRDPNCNPTNGIDRVDGSSVPNYVAAGVNVSTSGGAPELTVKNLSRWNTADYYNIWVVNKLDGADGTVGQFIAGFAYFPGSPSNLDGTIMLATQMFPGQKTLPHEIGHALNLFHPFQGSPDHLTCPINGNCNTDGDDICDTPPITYNQTGGVVDFTCRTGINMCGGNFDSTTEHNYMNYTSCFTLFTTNQKARMLAAMATLPSRTSFSTSLGATPTNSGATQCAPKINFELSTDAVTETTVTTTGCRSYKDYTYNMTIGNNPSVTATATLAVMSGTATEGVDFDITTNGNFAAPSKVVTFPAGLNTNQPFTIRIYDDAIVDGTENFTLNFSVNSGGGNAVLGSGKPTLTITINDNDTGPIVPGSTGTGNIGTAVTSIVPTTFDGTVQSQRTQMLYKASELTAAGVVAGNLTGIAFNLTKNSTRAFTNLTIKLGMTAVNNLINGGVTVISPMTTVETIPSYTTVNGWNTFTFTTPFAWNGTSNLAVEICFDNGTTAPGDNADLMTAYSDGGSASQGNIFFQSGINCGQAFSSVNGYVNGFKPMTRINFGNPGNAVATTAVTSVSQYLGPNADVYFYTAGGQILARITNLTSFDYGCTQVNIDRTGATSAQFWNTNTPNYLASKSFRVIPTNNTATGHYQISLYYSQAEVNGWQTNASQAIANAKLVKVSGGFYIPDVTPAAPHTANVITVSATNAGFGSDYVITGDFSSTGFSGFGVGVPGTASVLPITLVSFDGHKEGNAVQLGWVTATEFNNDHFEVETSKDNSNYYKIGSVDSRGNSTSDQFYGFADNLPAKGVNYYRLKQVDKDGKTTYSRVISVSFDGKLNNIQAYPNPVKDKMIVELAVPASGVSLTIFNLEGKMIRQGAYGYIQRSQAVDIHDLSSGTYILQVQTGADIYTLKFVKQ